MTTTHLMIDLETLGTELDTTIIGISLLLFNPETGELGPYAHYLPELEPQAGTINFDTVRWWLQAAPQLFTAYMERDSALGERVEWDELATSIAGLCSRYNVGTLWCRGIDFDIPRLMRALDVASSLPNPLADISFRHYRCQRQFLEAAKIAGYVSEPRADYLVKHDALADAKAQALEVIAIYKFLTARKVENANMVQEA